MTFFPEPLKPSEGNKEEDLRVNPIEADKQGKENQLWQKLGSKKLLAPLTAFLIFIEKLTNLLSKEKEGPLEAISEDGLISDIHELKQIFQLLMDRDQGKNSKFCEHFSKVWLRLIKELQILSHIKRKTNFDPKKLKFLIAEIENYPQSEDHKLGYYLSAFAGKDWLPTPFQEILKHLFTDHRILEQYSTLTKWTELTNDILQS